MLGMEVLALLETLARKETASNEGNETLRSLSIKARHSLVMTQVPILYIEPYSVNTENFMKGLMSRIWSVLI